MQNKYCKSGLQTIFFLIENSENVGAHLKSNLQNKAKLFTFSPIMSVLLTNALVINSLNLQKFQYAVLF